MKSSVVVCAFAVCLLGCNDPALNISGKWKPLAITALDNKTIDSNKSFGFFVSNMALSKGPEVFLFRSDTLYCDDAFAATYLRKGDSIRFNLSAGNRMLEGTSKISHDTLWLFGIPDGGSVTVFKRM